MRQELIGLLWLTIVFGAPTAPKATCGYDACPKPEPGKINVHLIPHTHNDLGWINTMEQNYYHSVQYILDTVTATLLKDPSRKFSYTEMGHFWKWWQQQTAETQEKVKTLVANGQLEFIGGGWSMNDEATVNYQSTIDQLTYSLRKLNDTFGECGVPRVAWQVDSFGHSNQQASIFAQSGYDGLFLSRIDYNDKNKRLNDKTMELLWQADPALGSSGDIFTHILYNHYTSTNNYCWDIVCSVFDEALVFGEESPDYNLPKLVNSFIDYSHNHRDHYNTDNVIAFISGDFSYVSAAVNYKNMDIMIEEVNKLKSNGSDVNVFYSTPSCYLNAVNSANVKLPTKQDDFFPYESEGHTYWTGFYSSRPAFKRLERQANNILQSAKRLSALTNVDASRLEDLKGALGVAQHHQAITGTSKQIVADDYARILTKGIQSGDAVIKSAINKIMKTKNPQAADLGLENCRLRNVSECAVSAEKTSFVVTLYNPLNFATMKNVRLPVQNVSYTVTDSEGQIIKSQLVPIPESLTRVPGRNSNTQVELVFNSNLLKPLGYENYYITKISDIPQNYAKVWVPEPGQEVSVGSTDTAITLDPDTGLLKTVRHRLHTYDLKQSLQYYVPSDGSNQPGSNRASGAYIFRPQGDSPHTISDKVEVTVVEGDVFTEIHQKFSDWASQIIRIYESTAVINEAFEIEWLVGPLDGGMEVISKYESSISTEGVFFTDSNGRGSVQRKRDFRPTWDLQNDEPVSGNYYPVASHITVKDSSSTLAVLTDRAQGGSSLQDGNLELMLHRQFLVDDNIGVQEALNEQAYGQGLVVRGSHKVFLTATGTTDETEIMARKLEVLEPFDSVVLLSDVTGRSQQQVSDDYLLQWSALDESNNFSDVIILLSLEPWQEGQLLVRFEHIGTGTGTDSIDLTRLFNTVNVVGARETTLAAQKFLDDSQRMMWLNKATTEQEQPRAVDITNVALKPQQIRTFILDVTEKKRVE